MAFSELDRALRSAMKRVANGTTRLSFSALAKWPLNKGKMTTLQSNLERLKTTLSLMLDVLNLASKKATRGESYSQPDVDRRRIERLIRSNEELYLSIMNGNPKMGSSNRITPNPTNNTAAIRDISEDLSRRTTIQGDAPDSEVVTRGSNFLHEQPSSDNDMSKTDSPRIPGGGPKHHEAGGGTLGSNVNISSVAIPKEIEPSPATTPREHRQWNEAMLNTYLPTESHKEENIVRNQVTQQFQACADAIEHLCSAPKSAQQAWIQSEDYQHDQIRTTLGPVLGVIISLPSHTCQTTSSGKTCGRVFPSVDRLKQHVIDSHPQEPDADPGIDVPLKGLGGRGLDQRIGYGAMYSGQRPYARSNYSAIKLSRGAAEDVDVPGGYTELKDEHPDIEALGPYIDEILINNEHLSPGVEALESRELNEAGEVLDEGGNILAAVQYEELRRMILEGEIDPDSLCINDLGHIVDQEGNVLEHIASTESSAERLSGAPLDIRILEGKKVNESGKIPDDDGEVIGELRDGDLFNCTGRLVNIMGEVLDEQWNAVGFVDVIRGKAAENATWALLEELGNNEEGEVPTEARGEPPERPVERYEQYEYGDRRESRRHECRNSAIRAPEASVERKENGLRWDDSQDRHGRGSVEMAFSARNPTQVNNRAQQKLISSSSHEPYVVGSLKDTSSMPPPPPPPPSAFQCNR